MIEIPSLVRLRYSRGVNNQCPQMNTPLIHLDPFIVNESRDSDCPYRASLPWDLYLELLLLWRRSGDAGLYVCCFGHIIIVCCSSMRGKKVHGLLGTLLERVQGVRRRSPKRASLAGSERRIPHQHLYQTYPSYRLVAPGVACRRPRRTRGRQIISCGTRKASGNRAKNGLYRK